jgi:hypothetical protein
MTVVVAGGISTMDELVCCPSFADVELKAPVERVCEVVDMGFGV